MVHSAARTWDWTRSVVPSGEEAESDMEIGLINFIGYMLNNASLRTSSPLPMRSLFFSSKPHDSILRKWH